MPSNEEIARRAAATVRQPSVARLTHDDVDRLRTAAAWWRDATTYAGVELPSAHAAILDDIAAKIAATLPERP